MKNKILTIFLIITFFGVDATVNYAKKKDTIIENKIVDNEIRAIYISYLEYFSHFYGGSKSVNEAKISKMIDNIYYNKFNVIILHVSPFSDSIYESKIMPYSYTLTGTEGKYPGFDYLDYFIKKSHSKNIKIYAWINPYRISFDSDTSKISKENPAYKLIGTSSIMSNSVGTYYNPSSEIVKNIILRQVEELIKKYPVDGIHFDDYFYMQKDIDKLEYQNYRDNGGTLSLQEYRLMQTNDLIKRVHETIQKENQNIVFSISPDGNINNNYLYHSADVKTWISSLEYVDMIMPQIYYGFENQYAPFDKVLNSWIDLVKEKEIKIVPVLAFYKVGTEDKEAGTGKSEWLNNSNIIKRQIKLIKEKELSGYALFRYDFLFNKNNMNENSFIELSFLQQENNVYK